MFSLVAPIALRSRLTFFSHARQADEKQALKIKIPQNCLDISWDGLERCLATLVAIRPQKSEQFSSAIMSPAGQVGHINYPSRISVPSRGFCLLGKHDLAKGAVFGSAFLAGALVFSANQAKNLVFGVGVPSRGFCFLSKTCPEKSRGAQGWRS